MVVCMWTVVYRNPTDQVTLDKSSEAAAREDFAAKAKEGRANGYSYVHLVRDGVVVESWSDS
jgi:hypothetical protein